MVNLYLLQTMKKEIACEILQDSAVFFDITGGESLVLVAFGMLSREYNTPIHMYEIWEDRLIERTDVRNEIDVLLLKGYIPVFISCKSGKMGAQTTLHALYEHDTVSNRFGGRYSKKVLVTVQKPNDIYLERAEEMGIEVRWIG